MVNLLKLKPYRKVRYDIRFHGNYHHAPVWQSEFADRVMSSFKLRAIMNPPHDSVPEINSTLASNKNRKVKNGIHPEKTKGKKKEEAVEKVKR